MSTVNSRPIVMYLEQVRRYGKPFSVTRSEVLYTNADGEPVPPHNRILHKADNKTLGEGFLSELIYVLGDQSDECRKLPYNRPVLVYTSNESACENYQSYMNTITKALDSPVHNYKLCRKLYDLCQERGYILSFRQNSLLGSSVRNAAMEVLLRTLQETDARGDQSGSE